MTIQLLVSTMHQTDYTLLNRMKLNSDAVVVNQCDRENKTVIEYNGYTVLWIDTAERGLSRSRNMAIRNATADICLLADDDMEYRFDYADTVISAFNYTGADIISFQVNGIEKKFKDYPAEESDVSYIRSMKIASVEIAFKRAEFEKKEIAFDEFIGAGTEFMMGEENAMLFQCLHKKLKIHYIPHVIADLHIGNSTWFTERDEKFFVGKGASFAAMRTPVTTLLIWQWAIRKKNLYKNDASVIQAIKLMQKGKRSYLKRLKEARK